MSAGGFAWELQYFNCVVAFSSSHLLLAQGNNFLSIYSLSFFFFFFTPSELLCIYMFPISQSTPSLVFMKKYNNEDIDFQF